MTEPVDEITRMSASEIGRAYRGGELSPIEVMDSVWATVDRSNPELNVFVTELRDESLKEAARAEEALRSDPQNLGPLHGIPMSVKDLTPTAGVKTTFGARQFADNVPDEDALAWARLKQAGAILIGKTTTPEWGWLPVTECELTGVTNNPWDPTRTPGGSSGGSAAAVAAGMGPVATGSDGAGSIRLPASFCGVVGLKPSVGRVPLSGEDQIFSTTEAVGPLTRTVEDAVLMLDVMQGINDLEAFTYEPAALDPNETTAEVAGLKVAFCPNLGGVPVDPEVAEAVAAEASLLQSELGAEVEEIEVYLIDPLDHLERFWGPANAHFLDDLVETYGADPDGFAPSMVALADLGRRMTGKDLWQAMIIDRGVMHGQIAAVFQDFDVLLTPTVPVTAFPHPGEAGGPAEIAGRKVANPLSGPFSFTAPFNMTGHPALSLPCGLDSDGLPIGIQLVGRHGADETILGVATALEATKPWPLAFQGGRNDQH